MKYFELRKEIELLNIEKSDIDWLFCEVLNIKRSQLGGQIEILRPQKKLIKKYAKKLSAGQPFSQVVGHVEFMGNKILVNKNVLSPRSETEELADMIIKDIKSNQKQNINVLDLCTGSGAIAVAAKTHTNASVTASDISGKALKVAKKNAKLNNAEISFVKSDMLNDIWGLFDYIVCNPPYIAYGDPAVDPSVNKFEPHLALYAEENGYHFYKILAGQVDNYLHKNGKLYLEVGVGMAQKVADLFKGYSSSEIKKDMQGIERFVIVTK